MVQSNQDNYSRNPKLGINIILANIIVLVSILLINTHMLTACNDNQMHEGSLDVSMQTETEILARIMFLPSSGFPE